MGLCLLTHAGTVLTYDPRAGAVGHVDLRDCRDTTRLLEIDVPAGAFRESFTEFLEGRLPEDHPIGPFGRATLVSADGLRVGLRVGDAFLGVANDGRIFAHAGTIGGWESFLPVPRRTIAALGEVLASDWLIEDSRTLVPAAAIRLENDMTIAVGRERFRLDELMSLDIEPGCTSLTFLPGGWRFRRLLRFDPVITFTAYRSEDVMQQLTLCVSSLIDPGGYRGRVHVFTDKPHHEIAERLAAVGAARVTTSPILATDFTGWVASKFAILDEPSFRTAQPILYLDADIVFDRAVVTDMLIDIALSRRLCAPTEDYSPLAHARSVGADFLRLAGYHDLGDARGLNGGTIGIPNLADHAADLRLISTLIMRYIRRHGRGSLEWVDQEITNYVGHARQLFDPRPLTPYARFGDASDLGTPRPRSGFVHFWKLRRGRVPVMRSYLEQVRAEAHATSEAAVPGDE